MNVTKTGGTNIRGGPYLGGNWWDPDDTDYAYGGSDTNSDGLGDTDVPHYGDYLPLTSPYFTNVSDLRASPAWQASGGYINISCNITDNDGIGDARLVVDGPGPSDSNTSMAHGTGDTYYLNTTYSAIGNYSFHVWVNDSGGNQSTYNLSAITIRDEFNSISYGGNDGSYPWTGNWEESSDDGSPSSGDRRVATCEGHNYALYMYEDNEGRLDRDMEFHPQSCDSAYISFDFYTDSCEDDDRIRIYFRGDTTDIYIADNASQWNHASIEIPEYYITKVYGASYEDVVINPYDLESNDAFYVDNFAITFNLSGFFQIYNPPPEIEDISDDPDPQDYDGYVNITCNVTDSDGLDDIRLVMDGPGSGDDFNESMDTGPGDQYYDNRQYTVTGSHSYHIYAKDNNGGTTISDTLTLSIDDNVDPVAVNKSDHPDPLEINGDIYIDCNVTDRSSMLWVKAYVDGPPGYGDGYKTMNNVEGDWWRWTSTMTILGEYSYYIYASDTFENTVQSGTSYYTVRDSTPPEISGVDASPDPQVQNGYVNITCTITDNVDVYTAKVHITYPDSSTSNTTLEQVGETSSYYLNTTYGQGGQHDYYIWCNDTSGIADTDTGHSFNITDTTAPEISDISASPPLQYQGGYVNITCNITDESNIHDAMVNVSFPDSTSGNNTLVNIQGTDTWYRNVTYSQIGWHNCTIWTNDTAGNGNTSGTFSFNITDMTPPAIDNVSDTPDPVDQDGYVNITCNVTDDHNGVDEVWVNITYATGSVTNGNYSMEQIGETSGYYFNQSYPLYGDYSYFIWANDTGGYHATESSISYSFVVNDTEAPGISGVSGSPDPQDQGGHVNITCTLTDNDEVHSASVNITYPDLSYGNNSLSRYGSSDTWYRNVTYSQAGWHNYTIWVNDTTGNMKTSGTFSFNITDISPPEISGISDNPDPVEYGGHVNITCTVTDNHNGVDEVWVNISYPSTETMGNYSMTQIGETSVYYLNQSYSSLGTFTYDIWANDTGGYSAMDGGMGNQFLVWDTSHPSITLVQALPYPQETEGYVNITCNVTDNVDVHSVSVNITLPDESTMNQSMAQIGSTDTYYYNTTYTLYGVYTYHIWANDTSGNNKTYATESEHVETVADMFNSKSYSENNGIAQWMGGWTEINESDGAQAGSEQVVQDTGPISGYHANYSLRIRDSGAGYGEGIKREVNLTDALSANLSFLYRRFIINGEMYFTVEIYNGTSMEWDTLETVYGADDEEYQEMTPINITGYTGGATEIRFMTSPNMAINNGAYIDNVTISYTVTGPPRFAIEYSFTDMEKPVISNLSSSHSVLPVDTADKPDGYKSGPQDNTSSPYSEYANITLNVTDASAITGVTINLTLLGGSGSQAMARIGETDEWYVHTNATAGDSWNGTLGAYGNFTLTVNATDEHGNWQTGTVNISVRMNGDAAPDHSLGAMDFAYISSEIYYGTAAIELNVADVTGNGAIESLDISYIYAHLLGGSPLY